jgi:hypothetical protein
VGACPSGTYRRLLAPACPGDHGRGGRGGRHPGLPPRGDADEVGVRLLPTPARVDVERTRRALHPRNLHPSHRQCGRAHRRNHQRASFNSRTPSDRVPVRPRPSDLKIGFEVAGCPAGGRHCRGTCGQFVGLVLRRSWRSFAHSLCSIHVEGRGHFRERSRLGRSDRHGGIDACAALVAGYLSEQEVVESFMATWRVITSVKADRMESKYALGLMNAIPARDAIGEVGDMPRIRAFYAHRTEPQSGRILRDAQRKER